MPDYRRVTCRTNRGGCGKTTDEVGPISWRGLCLGCAHRRENQAYDELTAHDGPVFQHWRHRIAASVGAMLLDDVTADVHTGGHA